MKVYEDLQDLLQLVPKEDVLYFTEDWNAKVGSQEIRGKFGLGVQDETGQRLTKFCLKNTLFIPNTHTKQPKRQLYKWT